MSDDPYIARLRAMKPRFKEMGLKRVRVFGSRLRGEARPDSDLDLLLEFYEIPSFFELADIKTALEKEVGKNIDITFSHKIVPELRDLILNEAEDV